MISSSCNNITEDDEAASFQDAAQSRVRYGNGQERLRA